ncbi:MAG: hypothetical protein H6618_10255, partial [Deltaproteobacteria bacterium]|nr:hypothetical protein [Deltaproteobacteria bacterium]
MFRPPELSLYTDSRIFRGFSRVVVRHSLAEIFHDFSLCLPDRRKPGQELPLKMGEFCQLKAGDQLLACGFADYLSQSLGGEGTTLEIYGRSQAADLSDSMPEPLEFPEEQSFRRIAEALLSPFSILLRTDSHADRLKLKQWK